LHLQLPPPAPRLPPPPYTTLFRSGNEAARAAADIVLVDESAGEVSLEDLRSELDPTAAVLTVLPAPRTRAEVAELVGAGRTVSADRKSTRLNSSHVSTSYAVSCLK